MAFQRKYFSYNKLRFSYLERGTGPTLLFFHGLFLEAETYRTLLNLLARTHRVIALDLPGFGQSDIPTLSWSIETYNQWFQSFVNMKRIHHASLVAHSYGCAIALAVKDNPALIRHVYLAPIFPETGLFHAESMGFLATCFVKTGIEMKRYRKKQEWNRFFRTASKNIARALVHPRRYYRHIHAVYTTMPNHTGTISLLILGKTDEFTRYNNAKNIIKLSDCQESYVVEGNHDFPVFEPELLFKTLIK